MAVAIGLLLRAVVALIVVLLSLLLQEAVIVLLLLLFEAGAMFLLLLLLVAVVHDDAILQLVTTADNSLMMLLLLLSALLTDTQGVNGLFQQDSNILRRGHDMPDMTPFIASTMTNNGHDQQQTLPVCFIAWSDGRTISLLLLPC
jgi:hypothetical protein